MAELVDNRLRAEWARNACNAFVLDTGQHEIDEDTDPELVDEVVGDLIGGLLHLLRRHGLEPEETIATARDYFEEEEREDYAQDGEFANMEASDVL